MANLLPKKKKKKKNEKKKKRRDHDVSAVKAFYRGVVTGTPGGNWPRRRRIDQWARGESPEIDPGRCDQYLGQQQL